ncbi:putative WRKY transcription factor 53 [Raphanus sativus]|uniref:Probable WRKY transcription factor 53 n=1 Tax=Raphanus sativus TaxID=3726 RepID=A0A6J0NHU8_RAPSA|nr:probable WRKY transcription factor 53 [Raphanus sativus]XP_056853913.1 probable WRKY transcription factor 53 [Raphanus sativus]KAJ4870807.1 putative WRKY transcription factor 53 [Raphanus sativus]KAJ4899624.1 putative WRKY transcription factor 53 [Raphanus sativus]
MEGKKDMLTWEQNTLLSELTIGLEAARKLHAQLGGSSSSSSSLTSFSSPATETSKILLKQILSSYEKSLAIVNWSSSPPVQLILKEDAVAPVTHSGVIPESPASINGSPRSEEFIDGGGSKDTHRQDHFFNSKKRKMLPKWTEKVRINPERGLEGPHQDDVYSWRKYGQKDILGAKFPRSYYRCTHRSTQNCWATKQVQRSNSDPTVFEVTYRGAHTCRQGSAAPPPPASPEKQDTRTKQPIAQTPNELLESLKTSLTVRTEGLDDGEDVFSFPNTPPFYDYGTTNDYFGGLMESSPIFDAVDWFNPTVDINPEFPTFLPDSIYY